MKDASYVLLSPKGEAYPLTKQQFVEEVDRLTRSHEWNTVVQDDNFLLLRKNQ